MRLHIQLPPRLPEDFFNMMTEEEKKDKDACLARIKECMEAYAERIEEQIPGARVEIEW